MKPIPEIPRRGQGSPERLSDRLIPALAKLQEMLVERKREHLQKLQAGSPKEKS